MYAQSSCGQPPRAPYNTSKCRVHVMSTRKLASTAMEWLVLVSSLLGDCCAIFHRLSGTLPTVVFRTSAFMRGRYSRLPVITGTVVATSKEVSTLARRFQPACYQHVLAVFALAFTRWQYVCTISWSVIHPVIWCRSHIYLSDWTCPPMYSLILKISIPLTQF